MNDGDRAERGETDRRADPVADAVRDLAAEAKARAELERARMRYGFICGLVKVVLSCATSRWVE